MSVLRALVLALVLTGCAPTPAPEPQPAPAPAPRRPTALSPFAQQIQADLTRLDAELRAPGVVSAGAGETAELGGELTVQPFAVIEDSRCPLNVTCLWAGRLRIRAAVSGRESELTLGEALQTPNGAILFVVASPGAWAEWPSEELGPRPAYRFGFRRE
jgi:hypothetical protein